MMTPLVVEGTLLLCIFLASGIQNALSAIYLHKVAEKRFLIASLVGTAMTGLGILAWKPIFGESAIEGSILFILVYLLGDFVGTYLGLTKGVKKFRKKNSRLGSCFNCNMLHTSFQSHPNSWSLNAYKRPTKDRR